MRGNGNGSEQLSHFRKKRTVKLTVMATNRMYHSLTRVQSRGETQTPVADSPSGWQPTPLSTVQELAATEVASGCCAHDVDIEHSKRARLKKEWTSISPKLCAKLFDKQRGLDILLCFACCVVNFELGAGAHVCSITQIEQLSELRDFSRRSPRTGCGGCGR
eukprot:2903159-Amphidinium_carterae.1